MAITAFIAWVTVFLGRGEGGKGRDIEEGMFPARQYWSSMGHAKCYSSQIVGSRVRRIGDQQSLVPNYRSATLYSCAWLNKKYYLTQGRKTSNQHLMGKMALGPQEWVFSEAVEWHQSVYMMINWWALKQQSRDHQKGQAMDDHHGRPVNWGKGDRVMREWAKGG